MASVCSRFWVLFSFTISLFLLVPAVLFWADNANDHYLLVTSFPALGGVHISREGPSTPCPPVPDVTPTAANFSCAWSGKEWTAEQLDACPDVKGLLQAWNSSRYFDGGQDTGNETQTVKTRLPSPPHLVDCDRVSREELSQDSRLPDGSLPAWANQTGFAGHPVPDPFWVRGADADNIPLTRQVQQDMWLHQHPLDCNAPDVRFLVVEWPYTATHGLGSQVHLLTGGLALALKTGRVFVIDNTFERAMHEGCTGESKGELDCYVLPPTSKECAAIAIAGKRQMPGAAAEIVAAAERPEERVVLVVEYATSEPLMIGMLPDLWGEPWRLDRGSIEFEGKIVIESDGPYSYEANPYGPTNWWRAQASRYLLRAPSAYLCRLMNGERHSAFGLEVAARLAESMRFQAEHAETPVPSGELEQALWKNDVFVPRPIISMHVRHAYQKSSEMRLVDLPSFMEQAERVRLHNPAVRSIWLSTESKDIVEAAVSKYTPHWNIYYSKVERIHSNENDPWASHAPPREGTDMAFVNLYLAADADYFVGVLGSNWNRLIDELRKTNGKLKAGYIALNYGQTR